NRSSRKESFMNGLLIASLIGLFAGVVGGMLGIGGGVIMIPALTILLGYSQQMAQGTTTAAMILPIGLLAAYAYYQKGYVNIPMALCISAGFFLGGYFGGKIAVAIDPVILKRIFAIFLIVIAVKMLAGK
ncbi:MAG TPA: sulfite exporter TauE/SafE family protein, partial [Spirochaetota bacterium]